jgi:hypothetical protein
MLRSRGVDDVGIQGRGMDDLSLETKCHPNDGGREWEDVRVERVRFVNATCSKNSYGFGWMWISYNA